MPLNATWTKFLQDEKLQRSSLCTTAIGSNIYVFGGELKARQPRDNDVYKVNLSSKEDQNGNIEKLTASTVAPSARVGATTTALNGKIYMFSGRGGEAMAPIDEGGNVWVFDPAKESWASLPPSSTDYPEARSYHCMAAGVESIYIHAGCPEKGRLSDLWSFNVTSSSWKKLATAPDPPRGGSSIAFVDGKIYRMNGFDGNTEQGGSIDVYEVSTDSWSTHTFHADGKSAPGARSVSMLVPIRVDGGTWLVTLFGESDPSALGHQGAGKMLNDCWAYSISDKSWSKIATAGPGSPEGRGWFDADALELDGRDAIAIVGGLGESNERLDDAWLLRF